MLYNLTDGINLNTDDLEQKTNEKLAALNSKLETLKLNQAWIKLFKQNEIEHFLSCAERVLSEAKCYSQILSGKLQDPQEVYYVRENNSTFSELNNTLECIEVVIDHVGSVQSAEDTQRKAYQDKVQDSVDKLNSQSKNLYQASGMGGVRFLAGISMMCSAAMSVISIIVPNPVTVVLAAVNFLVGLCLLATKDQVDNVKNGVSAFNQSASTLFKAPPPQPTSEPGPMWEASPPLYPTL